MGKWNHYKQKWGNCTSCELCDTRDKIVLAKGQLPCDVLFIGEAPGLSENAFGKPFVGPAGNLLSKMISDSGLDQVARLAFTNLIGCIPLDENLQKVQQPHKDHITACSERLQEFVAIAKPKVFVAVGKLSEKWIPKLLYEYIEKVPTTPIAHPAFILRSDPSQFGLLVQQTIIRLQDIGDTL